MAETVRLTGFRELHDALGKLKRSTERTVLRKIGKKALEPVIDRATELVPVDTGNLRDSLVISSSLSSRARRAERGEPKGGVKVYAGSNSRNAVPQEYGTFKQAAQPFLRPAWDSERDGVLAYVGRELGNEIEKAAARAARRKK